MSSRAYLLKPRTASQARSAAKARAAFMAGIAARRSGAITAARISGSRPLGLPATRGFRPVGRRGTERKVIDVGVTTPDVNTTGSISLLNGCIQGTDYTNRIGRKIVVKSVYIRGAIVNQAANANTQGPAASAAQACRMILFVDMQPNGATPAVNDLLVTISPYSQLNLNNRDRFRVIKDKMYFLDPYLYEVASGQAYASASNQIKQIKCFKNMNLETIYNSGNAGTIGDITSGALYLLLLGNRTGVDAAQAPLSVRVRFVDP